VKKIILSEHFWKCYTNFWNLVAPIVNGLQDLNAKIPCMGKLLHIMRELKKHALALQKKLFCLASHLAIPLKELFCEQWKMVEIDLHYARALLSPYLLHN